MILLDPRAGSADYLQPLRALGAVVESTMLEFADVAFAAQSSGMVGIELKKLNDVLQCIDSGRFAGHQLPGLLAHYDAVYLVIEGFWRPSPTDGTLETLRGREWISQRLGKRYRLYRELDNWLTTMEVMGRVHIRRTSTEHETARVVFDLYDWYSREDEHRSHLAFDRSALLALESQVAKEQRRGGGARLFLDKPSPKRVFAATLPKIGVEKSADVAAAFPNIRAMVNASEKDWLAVPGIGKGIVKQVRAWLEE